MASKHLQEKKQNLLDSLTERRANIESGTGRIQQVTQQNIKNTEGERRNLRLSNVEGLRRGPFSKVLSESKNIAKTQREANAIRPSQAINKKSLVAGIGLLCVAGILLSGKKKRKQKKKKLLAEKVEKEQVVKYGAGVLVLKWLLAASQPAVKHYITKRVKRSIVG